jgi:S1-C subfamily serine protease
MMLTNNHVVAGAAKVQVVMPDGRHYSAAIQGTDPLEDIAVIRIPDNTLPLAQFGDSTKVAVGQPVVAIGNPEGQTGSVTQGIISAVHRTLQGVGGGNGIPAEDLPDVIQTDAPINPGNSGGPLADAQGLVIGVNTAGETQAQSIGFAIPSLIAKRIAEALMAGKTPGHPYLGICYQDLATALLSGKSPSGYGVLIAGTVAGGPADKAGIKAGDVVEKVDNVDLNNGNTLGGVLQLHNPGDSVPFIVVRGSGTTTLQVTLADRPASPPSC